MPSRRFARYHQPPGIEIVTPSRDPRSSAARTGNLPPRPEDPKRRPSRYSTLTTFQPISSQGTIDMTERFLGPAGPSAAVNINHGRLRPGRIAAHVDVELGLVVVLHAVGDVWPDGVVVLALDGPGGRKAKAARRRAAKAIANRNIIFCIPEEYQYSATMK